MHLGGKHGQITTFRTVSIYTRLQNTERTSRPNFALERFIFLLHRRIHDWWLINTHFSFRLCLTRNNYRPNNEDCWTLLLSLSYSRSVLRRKINAVSFPALNIISQDAESTSPDGRQPLPGTVKATASSQRSREESCCLLGFEQLDRVGRRSASCRNVSSNVHCCLVGRHGSNSNWSSWEEFLKLEILQSTDDWSLYIFETVMHTVQLPKGKQAVAIVILGRGFALNGLSFKRLTKNQPISYFLGRWIFDAWLDGWTLSVQLRFVMLKAFSTAS